jgi:hypothetical protein
VFCCVQLLLLLFLGQSTMLLSAVCHTDSQGVHCTAVHD